VSAAPDLVVALTGYRSWRVAGGRLLSPFVPCRWEGRELHAACWDANRILQQGRGWLAAPHASPDPRCQCGIYAWDRAGLRTYYGESWWCDGVVSGWGRVVVHRDGWRAEHARVAALALPDGADARLAGAVRAVAERLGVPLVAGDELPLYAERAGTPVPGALRPLAAQ
jgi:hypothetical protein